MTRVTSLVLYYSPGACSLAPHIVLAEIGRPFETVLVVSRGETEGRMTATPEWRKINPKGRIPALLGVSGNCGGAPELLTEVPAIMMYLAMRYRRAQLLPKKIAAVSRCLEWMNWLSSNVHAMSYGQIWRARRYSDADGDLDGIRKKGRLNLTEQHGYIERVLNDGRPWAVPDGYSIVDPYLLVFYRWGERLGFNMRKDCPAWTAIMDRVLARDAVQRVVKKEAAIAI